MAVRRSHAALKSLSRTEPWPPRATSPLGAAEVHAPAMHRGRGHQHTTQPNTPALPSGRPVDRAQPLVAASDVTAAPATVGDEATATRHQRVAPVAASMAETVPSPATYSTPSASAGRPRAPAPPRRRAAATAAARSRAGTHRGCRRRRRRTPRWQGPARTGCRPCRGRTPFGRRLRARKAPTAGPGHASVAAVGPWGRGRSPRRSGERRPGTSPRRAPPRSRSPTVARRAADNESPAPRRMVRASAGRLRPPMGRCDGDLPLISHRPNSAPAMISNPPR
jgi:hypothetical protein